MKPVLGKMKGGLIVSCQASEGSPLCGPQFMSAMARSAELGGAVGVRANGVEDIRAIRERVSLPIIGILKRRCSDGGIWITIEPEDALAVVQAGADIVALDATKRLRPSGKPFAEITSLIKKETSALVMADISTFEEGQAAATAGADIVATTLSGYTYYSRQQETPDVELIETLRKQSGHADCRRGEIS